MLSVTIIIFLSPQRQRQKEEEERQKKESDLKYVGGLWTSWLLHMSFFQSHSGCRMVLMWTQYLTPDTCGTYMYYHNNRNFTPQFTAVTFTVYVPTLQPCSHGSLTTLQLQSSQCKLKKKEVLCLGMKLSTVIYNTLKRKNAKKYKGRVGLGSKAIDRYTL